MVKIAIVGGGAAGVSALYQLIEFILKQRSKEVKQQVPQEVYQIFLIEKSEKVGPGLAYSTNTDAHILNLPFAQMSPIPNQPDHFKNWLKDTKNLPKWRNDFPTIDIDQTNYLPRRLFGIYLNDLAMEIKKKADDNDIQVEFIHDEAIDILPCESIVLPLGENTDIDINSDLRQKIILKNQRPLVVNKSILCLGHLPPSQVGYEQFRNHPKYYQSPWGMNQENIPIDEDILILGTRLSAIDAILERESYVQKLISQGYQGPIGKIFAVSRIGLPPRVLGRVESDYHRRYLTLETLEKMTDGGTKPIAFQDLKKMFKNELKNAYKEISDKDIQIKLRSLFARNLAMNAESWLEQDIDNVKNNKKRPWQTVLFSLYPIVPNLWEALDDEGKKEFLTNYYSFWMTYLAAFPLGNAEKILRLQKSGRLEMLGGLENVFYNDKTAKFEAHLKRKIVSAAHLINATGQAHDITQTDSPLLNNLLHSETIQPHPLGGINVKFKSLQVIEKFKKIHLYVVGDPNWGAFMATADLAQIVKQIKKVVNSIMGAKRHYGNRLFLSPENSPSYSLKSLSIDTHNGDENKKITKI